MSTRGFFATNSSGLHTARWYFWMIYTVDLISHFAQDSDSHDRNIEYRLLVEI